MDEKKPGAPFLHINRTENQMSPAATCEQSMLDTGHTKWSFVLDSVALTSVDLR